MLQVRRGFSPLYFRLVILSLSLPFSVFDNEPQPGMHIRAFTVEIIASGNAGDGVAGKSVGDEASIVLEEHCLHHSSRGAVVRDGVVYVPESV